MPGLLPTSLVGSYPQPDWLIDRERLLSALPPRVRARELWRVDERWLAEAQDDATALAIHELERAGLDVLTDGEIRRESYSNRFATALDGMDVDNPARVPGRAGGENLVPRVVGPVRRARPVEVDDLRFLRDMLRHAYYWRISEDRERPVYRYVQNWGRRGDAGVIALEGAHPAGAAWYRLFDERAPAGHVLLTTFAGGRRDPDLPRRSDADIAGVVHAELSELVGATAAPRWQQVVRWARAIPQYTLGHLDRLRAIDDAEARHAGLFFCASYRGGVSVADCIKSAHAMAERVAAAANDAGEVLLFRGEVGIEEQPGHAG